MKKRIYLLVLSVLCVAFARAEYVEPSEGVFRIINMEYGNALMEDFVRNTLHCSEIGGEEEYDQMWELKQSGTGYTLQNIFTGNYIQTGNNTNNVAYWTGKEADVFTIAKNTAWEEVSYNIWDPALGYAGLHYSPDQGAVVRWWHETSKKATEWRFVSVDITEEQIAKAKEEFTRLTGGDNLDAYQTVLGEVFEDPACTVLNETYAAMDAEAIRTALADKLPATLVDMAVKTKTGEWAEPNEKADKPGWDSAYAKKFRVQMIEPHSIAGEITEWIGHQGHTNMDNPIGIYANKRDVLYIMVEGEVKEGAELWACWINGHSKMPNYNNGYSNGIRLKSGLNIVPFGNDGSALYINYLVHTFNKGTWKFQHKLSDFDDLKVHIEGGYINGYYNRVGDALYTGDTDADWVYYEERANLRNITVLGRYQILQFELNDVTITEEKDGAVNTWTNDGLAKLWPEKLQSKNLPDNQRINAVIDAWDRIHLSEKMTLGVASKADVDSMNILCPRYDAKWENKAEIYNYEGFAEFCDSLNPRDNLDYGEYYNHHGLAFGTTSGYMYGSWDHCGYHVNTTPSILVDIVDNAGSAWGPGHEIGHQHQASFTYNGLMEVTNNVFANIAVWYMGMGTSRLNATEGNLEHVYAVYRDGGDVFGNQGGHIWANTQMYYRLWLYYHRVGYNTQFFPRLFELLRENPLVKSYGSGSEVRDGENVNFQLTSGKTTILKFYQLCCEAAQEDLTEFFRAYGFFTVMDGRFVGDYSNSKYYQTQKEIDQAIAQVKAKGYPINNKPLFINDATNDPTYGHDGKTRRSFWDNETASGLNAKVGCYVDYLAKDTITGKYLYSLENLKVTVKGGDGAVGFAVYTNEGEIKAFSNNYSFYLNNEVLAMLRTREAKMVAVTPAGDDIVIENSATIGNSDAQFAALQEALELAKSYLERVDTTGTKIGFLIPDSIKDFSAFVAKVDEVVTNKDTTEYSYGEWYANLDAAIVNIQRNAAARVPLFGDCFYSVTLSSNESRYMGTVAAGLNTTVLTEVTENAQWKLVPTGTTGTYYMQNRETGNYITVMQKEQRAKAASSDMAEAVAFKLIPADAPGEFFIQHAGTADLNLYNNGSNNRVQAGEQTGSNAKWMLRLEESLLAQPVVSTDEQITIYYMQRTDNREYAYHKSAGRTDKGRIASGTLDNTDNLNYWFYFTEGNEEGKYAIYNYATGLSVTANGVKLYANKESESTIDYAITLNEDYTGLVISAAEGDWYMTSSKVAELSTNARTTWMLQRVRTISLTNEPLTSLAIDKTEVTLNEGESVVLTVTTAPVFATNHTVTWSSSDAAVATVDENGTVKAVAEGSATITATANDGSGLTATCKVTVEKVAGITATSAGISVQTQGGLIAITGLTKGTAVNVYDTAGKQIAKAIAANGKATIDTQMPAGSTVIVKIGEYSMKVSL